MGLYGSPELSPKDPKGEETLKKKSYLSKYSIAFYIFDFLAFILFFVAGGKNKIAFFVSLFMVATFSVVVNLVAIILCKFKKVKNNIYKRDIKISIILILISFGALVAISPGKPKNVDNSTVENDEKITNTGNKDVAEAQEETSKISDIIDMDYVFLWSNYSDQEYKDKYVRIIGKINYVSKNSITINEGLTGFTGYITMDFADNKDALANAKEGLYLTITGKCKQKALGYLYLEDCDIEDASSSKPEKMIAYEKVRNQNLAKEKENYISSAQVISYNELIRNPDKYKGTIMYVDLNISQELIGGIITESGYAGKESGDEWYVHYELSEGESRILAGDTVRFYGEFTGLSEMKRALTGTKVLIPRLEAKYRD